MVTFNWMRAPYLIICDARHGNCVGIEMHLVLSLNIGIGCAAAHHRGSAVQANGVICSVVCLRVLISPRRELNGVKEIVIHAHADRK